MESGKAHLDVFGRLFAQGIHVGLFDDHEVVCDLSHDQSDFPTRTTSNVYVIGNVAENCSAGFVFATGYGAVNGDCVISGNTTPGTAVGLAGPTLPHYEITGNDW